MRFAAATVKDTLVHVQRFVAGNLAGGIDHLVIFIDAPGAEGQAEVLGWLEEQEAVTCVRAGGGWFGAPGRRPGQLNRRQCINANAVKQVLAGIGPAEPTWLFHIDGDEIVRLDEEALAAVPATTQVVSLGVRETVSRWDWTGEPHLFKYPLEESDLDLLVVLGVLERAHNRDYFHGHLMGKSGVRPEAAGLLTLHKVIGPGGAELAAHTDPALELFHYESYSGVEFVRKWTTMVASGPPASYRPGRAATARSLHHLLGKDLDPQARERVLRRIFDQTTRDDVETLSGLGLLIDTDPSRGFDDGPRTPQPVPAPTLRALREGLAALRGVPKQHLYAERRG